MFHSRRSPDPALLKILACVAALGVLACLWLAVRTGVATPARLLLLLAVAAALLAGLRRLLAQLAELRDQPDLTASELATLTFPPESRLERPRLQRAK